jgi:hypothetical protein
MLFEHPPAVGSLGPLDPFSPTDGAFLDYVNSGMVPTGGEFTESAAEPSTSALHPSAEGMVPGPEDLFSFPAIAPPSAYTLGPTPVRMIDMLPAQPRTFLLHPAPILPAELYPMEPPPAFPAHDFAHQSLAMAEGWHGQLLEAAPLQHAAALFPGPSMPSLASPGGALAFHAMPPPPPTHAQFIFHDGPPTPSVWPAGPQGTFAGAFELSTGQFYYGTEHPRLRTPQACEPCRQRKAKV